MQACRANVIIVEDDMGVSRAVARLLNIAGFRSSSFNSAEGLLQSDSAPAADCFVFDIHLPGLTGVDAAIDALTLLTATVNDTITAAHPASAPEPTPATPAHPALPAAAFRPATPPAPSSPRPAGSVLPAPGSEPPAPRRR